jgi:uncharacterized protein YcbX
VHVAELWRYPVKSLAGEPLDEAELGLLGLPGDRVVHARLPDGRIVTARPRPRLLGLAAVLGPDGEPLVDGVPWNEPAVLEAVRQATGLPVELIRDEGAGRFDVLPVSVATDGAVATLGIDRRRLRPNVLVGGVDGLAERDWPGRLLRIGEAVVSVTRLRPRCVMTTYDPDTLERDPSVLRRIVERFDGSTALDCSVVRPGHVRVGDPVELLERGS